MFKQGDGEMQLQQSGLSARQHGAAVYRRMESIHHTLIVLIHLQRCLLANTIITVLFVIAYPCALSEADTEPPWGRSKPGVGAPLSTGFH
jgi:hypothetical protein